jgi:hypothetical protein
VHCRETPELTILEPQRVLMCAPPVIFSFGLAAHVLGPLAPAIGVGLVMVRFRRANRGVAWAWPDLIKLNNPTRPELSQLRKRVLAAMGLGCLFWVSTAACLARAPDIVATLCNP